MSAEPAGYTLAQLSDAWNRFGCAICSHVPSPFATEGSKVELHHILPRSQGGSDDPANLMGLCGELCEERCHWKVTQNLIKISWSENAHSWIWQTADGITIGFCRPLDASMISQAGMGDELIRHQSPVSSPAGVLNQVPIEWVPEGTAMGATIESAQARFLMARELHTEVERGWLRLSIILQYAMSNGDHLKLGFRTIGEWADAIGISKPSMSKLRLVSRTFQGSWVDLPQQDQDALSSEGLYIAARMVKMGTWTVEQGLHEAVAQPVGHLWQAYVVERQGEFHTCECPVCGATHKKKLEPPLE